MNFKTTFVLLALLLVGGSALWFVWNTQPETANTNTAANDSAETKMTPVLDPEPVDAEIVKIEFARADKPPIAFERSLKDGSKDQYEDWRITAPVAAQSETWTVNGMISSFAKLQSQIRFDREKGQKLSDADAGLDKPRAKITFTTKDGKQRVLEIGKQHEFPTGTYVRAAGSPVIHLVERDFSAELKRELKDFRGKTLTKFSVNDVNHLTIDTEGKHFDASRVADGWVLNEPVKARADSKKINEILTKLAALRAVDFLPDDAAAATTLGLDQPFAKVTINTETHKAKPTTAPAAPESQPAAPEIETITRKIELAVGNFADLKQTNRYAQLIGQPGVATVANTSVDAFAVKLPALVDSQVTGLAKDRISKLDLSAGGQSATVERKDGVWTGAGDLAALDTDSISTLVATLQDLKAISVVENAESLQNSGLDAPRAVITATMEGSISPLTLRIGANTASGVNAYARVDGQPLVYVIDAKEAAKLVIPPLALRSRVIVDAKPEDVSKVDRTRGDTTYSLVREAGMWKLAQPADAALDLAAAQQVATDLARLRAKRVVARDRDAEFGLDQPAVTIKFTVSPQFPTPPGSEPADAPPPPGMPQVERTLRVAWKDNAAYARLESEPFIYELDESVYKVLSGELLRRELFDFAPEAVVSVQVESPEGALEFVKKGENWEFGPDPFVKLAQDKVKTFINDVAKLRADEYVGYSNAAAPAQTPISVTLKLQNDRLAVLKVGPAVGENQPRIGYLPDAKRSFKVRPIDVENLTRKLEYYLQSDKPAAPSGMPPGMQGMPPGMQGGPQGQPPRLPPGVMPPN